MKSRDSLSARDYQRVSSSRVSSFEGKPPLTQKSEHPHLQRASLSPFDKRSIVWRLLVLGLVSRLVRGSYYPTASGWVWIDGNDGGKFNV